MKQTRILMGMPVTLEFEDLAADERIFRKIFSYFESVENKFSVFKSDSEITQVNKGLIAVGDYSKDLKIVLDLAKKTKEQTSGYFDILDNEGKLNPAGLVKGWAIYNAAKIAKKEGFQKFYIEAGGDIQAEGKYWKIGIRNPFNINEIIKIIYLKDKGIATSGTYVRGQHIYNPIKRKNLLNEIVSFSVIGSNIYEADRFATAAFAMGKEGINFIENLNGFEGYIIDNNGIATITSHFEEYALKPKE